MGRFICADGFTSTGQGILGSSMYAYCLNNPVAFSDSTGQFVFSAFLGAFLGDAIAGALISGVSYLVSQNMNNAPVSSSGFWGDVAVGAIVGGFGGAAGLLPASVHVAVSVGVGVVSGVYAAATNDGSFAEKIIDGVTTAAAVAATTYLGTKFDPQLTSAPELAVVAYALGLSTSAPSEVAVVTARKVIIDPMSDALCDMWYPTPHSPSSGTTLIGGSSSIGGNNTVRVRLAR